MAPEGFVMDERLRRDAVEVTRLSLSVVLLMNDRTVPWLVLVPMRPGVTEFCELKKEDRAALSEEIAAASLALKDVYSPDKLNIGSLGNIVPQLHVHVMGRFVGDRAWPGPVWGSPGAAPYAPQELVSCAERLRDRLRGARNQAAGA